MVRRLLGKECYERFIHTYAVILPESGFTIILNPEQLMLLGEETIGASDHESDLVADE
jgi:hypothetical protein